MFTNINNSKNCICVHSRSFNLEKFPLDTTYSE
jgi:hypothetical protein